MASHLFTLLLILPVIYAKIEVNIVASEIEAKRSIDLSGSNVAVISDTEIKTFGLTDRNLKNGVGKYFGKVPTDVFVKSPTPWGDLYKTYEWTEVTRTLSPQKWKILTVRTLPVIVQTQEFSNNSTKTGNFLVKIEQLVMNTVLSSWEKNQELTVGQDINYGISIDVISVSGNTNFSYTSKWGERVSKSEVVTVGSKSGVEISLEPNQRVTAEIQATKGYMEVEVDYEASLSGKLAVNYATLYKNHHFWALDVNAVMKAAGLENIKRSKEVIKLDYYTDSKVIIKDFVSNSVLYTVPLKLY